MIDMRVKFFVPEGHYQRFMAWMANAMFGKTNPSILCWYGDTTEAILEFLRRVLPNVVVDDRIRCLKKYAARTIVFPGTVPRTQRQRQKVIELSRACNVVFVNPNRTAATSRLHDIYEILDGIHPELLENTDEFVCLVRKFYLATHTSCLQVSHFLEYDRVPQGSSLTVYKRFLEYRMMHWPMQRSIGFLEFLASMSLIPGSRVTAQRLVAPLSLIEGGSWLSWFNQSYLNSTGFLLWLIRVHSGLVLPSTIMVVDDPTTTTVDWMRHAVKHLRVGYVSSAEDSFLLVDYASYDLVIFDHFEPLLDLVTVAARTNVMIIGSYMTVRAQVVRAEFVGFSRNDNDGIPHAYFISAYDVIVKEPTFVVFVRQCIEDNTYPIGRPLNIRQMLSECNDWCDRQRIPWKITASIALQVQEITAAIALRSYFRCACAGSTVVFWGSKRYLKVLET
jgi:hypothetical protein